jgi:hypothetical protein
MLRGTLLHTYKRYKADTDRVIRWLVDNSRYKVKADVSANILPELARNVPPNHDSENVLRILTQVIQARTECAAQYKYKSHHQTSNETQHILWKRSIVDYRVRQMNTCVFVSLVYASKEKKVFYHML